MLVGSNTPLFQDFQSFSGDTAMAEYSDVLDEATLALISEIDQVHRSSQPQDTVKYVNSLTSLGRHLQLQEFRSWLNHKCGLPIAVRPTDVDLNEYMEKEQIEAWIHEWTQRGTWLYHPNESQHQTRPSSCTPGMRTPNVGSSSP